MKKLMLVMSFGCLVGQSLFGASNQTFPFSLQIVNNNYLIDPALLPDSQLIVSSHDYETYVPWTIEKGAMPNIGDKVKIHRNCLNAGNVAAQVIEADVVAQVIENNGSYIKKVSDHFVCRLKENPSIPRNIYVFYDSRHFNKQGDIKVATRQIGDDFVLNDSFHKTTITNMVVNNTVYFLKGPDAFMQKLTQPLSGPEKVIRHSDTLGLVASVGLAVVATKLATTNNPLWAVPAAASLGAACFGYASYNANQKHISRAMLQDIGDCCPVDKINSSVLNQWKNRVIVDGVTQEYKKLGSLIIDGIKWNTNSSSRQ